MNVLLGRGDGSFAEGASYDLNAGANAIAMGDVDADGNLDIVVADQYSYTVSLMLGLGNGTFQAPIGLTATSMGPTALALAEHDGHGMTILVGDAPANQISVLPSESHLVCGN